MFLFKRALKTTHCHFNIVKDMHDTCLLAVDVEEIWKNYCFGLLVLIEEGY